VKRALALNADEPVAITINALDLSMAGHFDEAAQMAKRACEISPNEALGWLGLARILINGEHLEEGERAIRAAMRLNPFYPVNYLAVLADALVHQGRNREAVDVLGQIVSRSPNFISAHLHLAGLYDQSGEKENAQKEVAEVLRINPAYRLTMARRFYLSSDERRKKGFIDALREAGLPE